MDLLLECTKLRYSASKQKPL